MCSIIGFKVGTKHQHEENIEEYMTVLQERGDQSFGFIAKYPNGDIYYSKTLYLKSFLSSLDGIPSGSWVFIHARKASAGMAGTTTAEKLERAHPVFSDDEKIILLHNGTKNSLHDTIQGSKSDSQALATLLSLTWEHRRLYYGNIGVVIYERDGDIYLYKDGMRPLVMAEDNTIFASEPVDDKLKWKNVKVTLNDKGEPDTKLDFDDENLGLEFDDAVEIKFIPNNYTYYGNKGYPTVSFCPSCKAKHIENQKTTVCCVCAIEGKTLVPSTPTSVASKLPDGVLFVSADRQPTDNEAVLFTCDTRALREASDITGAAWAGTATIKADVMHRTKDGTPFFKPTSLGKYVVKVDRVFINKAHPKYKLIWDAKEGKLVSVIGELDSSKTMKLTTNLDMSKANLKGIGSGVLIEMKSTVNANKSTYVGFDALLSKK